MAYSTIYNIFNNAFYIRGFESSRPSILQGNSFLKKARKLNVPVLGYKGRSVAFPNNYKLDSEIELSAYDQVKGKEYTGYYEVNNYHNLEAVILIVKNLFVKVPVPVKPGFFQSIVKQAVLEQTHTISSCNGIISVQGKFKFNQGFLELDFEE